MQEIQQNPWALRQAEASNGEDSQAIQQLLREPIPSILLGAALLSGQPCLLQNAQTILDNRQLKPGSSCWTLMVRILKELSDMEELQSYTTLFHLLVEPFAFMDQSAACEIRKEHAT